MLENDVTPSYVMEMKTDLTKQMKNGITLVLPQFSVAVIPTLC